MKHILWLMLILQGCSNSLNGEFKCKNELYSGLVFSENSVIIKSEIFGVKQEYSTTYRRSGEQINVKTDKSDLVYKIVNSNTLQGQEFSEGICTKIK